MAQACRQIEQSETVPSLTELADAVDLSPGYFHRLFKAVTGLTPKAYAKARQAERVREHLAQGQSVTAAIYDAGFNSSGRFYADANDMLGMTPSKYRSGGVGEDIRFAVGQSSLGAILVASSAKGVAAILMGEDPDALVRDLQDRFPRARLLGADADYEQLVAQVVGMIEAPQIGLDLPLDVRGTAFQQRVWRALRDIPAGRTVSYAEVAQAIGSPQGGARGGGGMRRQQHRGRHSLPPGGAQRWVAVRLCLGRRAQTGADQTGSRGLTESGERDFRARSGVREASRDDKINVVPLNKVKPSCPVTLCPSSRQFFILAPRLF